MNNDSETESEDGLLSDFEDVTQAHIVDPHVSKGLSRKMNH